MSELEYSVSALTLALIDLHSTLIRSSLIGDVVIVLIKNH